MAGKGDRELTHVIRRAVRNAAADRAEVKRLREVDYSSVLGNPLPDWVPQWDREKYVRTRHKLVEYLRHGDPTATSAQMRDRAAAYRELGNSSALAYRPPPGSFPIELQPEIEHVATVNCAIARGPINGRELLGDKGGADLAQRRKSGGEKRARTTKSEGEKTLEAVKDSWNRLKGHPPRERAGIIAVKIKMSADHVRTLIRKAGLR